MKRHRILISVASFAVLTIAIIAMRMKLALPPVTANAGAGPLKHAGKLPDFAQPAVAKLITDVHQVRIDPACKPDTTFTTELHPSGVLRYIGMEPGWSLGTIGRDQPLVDAVREYLMKTRAAWGLANPRVDLELLRHRSLQGRDVVRLQETYGGVPVFAAQLVAHVRNGEELACVLADPGMNFNALDSLALPLDPKVDAAAASMHALAAMTRRHPAANFNDPGPAETKLIVYSPEVLGLNGEAELAWEVSVLAREDSPEPAAARWIVSATDGELLNYFDRLHSALSRTVWDFNSATNNVLIVTIRDEGEPATGIAEVDNAYDYIGQIHNFFSARHGRDSYNGAGAVISANVRVCQLTQCPWPNANSGSGTGAMNFGAGFVTDDIVAHEFTHKVIEFESGLLYQNASGAINESLCDIWGEIFDQSNSGLTPSGTDTAAVKWLIGEDNPAGASRSMSNPAVAPFGDPDRMGHGNFTPPVSYPRGAAGSPDNNDDGGVHNNSGVGNKLCFLLCEGGSFNGIPVNPLGNANTLELFYEVNTNLLTPASDWLDLNFALRQAAINLGYFSLARDNVGAACDAVEINRATHTKHLDVSTNAPLKVGIPEVSGSYGPFNTLESGIAGVGTGGTLKIQGTGGPVNVSRGFTLTQPLTLRTYDPFPRVSGGAVTNDPPTPVTIQAP